MRNIKYILALAFAVLFIFFGVFAGLQISPAIGNVILFPFVLPAYLTDTGFGYFPGYIQLGLFILTVLFWSAVFIALINLKKRRK
ncbi:hypothetical protein [Candidatus Mycalebacterium sp.]